MGEKEIIKAVKEHVKNQNNNWKFIMGRQVLTKKAFLERLDKDKEFRRTIVDMVVRLSIDILTKRGE